MYVSLNSQRVTEKDQKCLLSLRKSKLHEKKQTNGKIVIIYTHKINKCTRYLPVTLPEAEGEVKCTIFRIEYDGRERILIYLVLHSLPFPCSATYFALSSFNQYSCPASLTNNVILRLFWKRVAVLRSHRTVFFQTFFKISLHIFFKI